MANIFPKKHQRNILAFVHIEKAAGTTLIHLLRINFFLRYCDVRPLCKNSNRIFTATDLAHVMNYNPILQCIGGHSIRPFSDLETFFPNIRYFTILRNPIKRYVSQYRYWVDKLERDLSFEKFMEIRASFNLQTKKIFGNFNVNKTKFLVDEKLFLIGTVEKFDEFLLIFKNKIKPLNFNPNYDIVNSASQRSSVAAKSEELIDRYREQIISRNELDIELNEYVRDKIYPKEIKSYGSNFYHDLAEFKKNNQGYQNNVVRFFDYIVRKGYYEPVFGILRKREGLTYKGSY